MIHDLDVVSGVEGSDVGLGSLGPELEDGEDPAFGPGPNLLGPNTNITNTTTNIKEGGRADGVGEEREGEGVEGSEVGEDSGPSGQELVERFGDWAENGGGAAGSLGLRWGWVRFRL
jgi:hypothetical protein